MSYINDFPHTRNYDSDLGWLIKAYKELLAKYEELLAEVERLRELYVTIPDEIESALNAYKAQIDAIIEAYDARIVSVEETVASFSDALLALDRSVLNFYNGLKSYIDKEDAYYYAKCKAMLEEYINTEGGEYYCPVDGKLEGLQTILYHMANYYSLGIQVEVFDALNIPVEILEGMKIIVQYFDRWGKFIFMHWKKWLMVNPFSGAITSIQKVVLNLYEVLATRVSVSDIGGAQVLVDVWDNEELDVETVDMSDQWFTDLQAVNGE